LIGVLLFGYGYIHNKNHEHHHEEPSNEAEIDKSKDIQDSIINVINTKDKAIKNLKAQIDSTTKSHEKIKSKPKPINLRSATVTELDSFWTNYKAHQ
jgi:hypothetical protein